MKEKVCSGTTEQTFLTFILVEPGLPSAELLLLHLHLYEELLP
jgi:hypothetical protein